MGYPIFTSFLILCVVLFVLYKKSEQAQAEVDEAFWEKERRSKIVPSVNLDTVAYIEVPTDRILTVTEGAELSAAADRIREISGKRILCLSGMSNADVRLKYGTATFDTVSQYGDNFDELIMALDAYSDLLLSNNYRKEATGVLEYAIGIGSDLSTAYDRLIKIYQEDGSADKLSNLLPMAEKLSTPMKSVIIKNIEAAINPQGTPS